MRLALAAIVVGGMTARVAFAAGGPEKSGKEEEAPAAAAGDQSPAAADAASTESQRRQTVNGAVVEQRTLGPGVRISLPGWVRPSDRGTESAHKPSLGHVIEVPDNARRPGDVIYVEPEASGERPYEAGPTAIYGVGTILHTPRLRRPHRGHGETAHKSRQPADDGFDPFFDGFRQAQLKFSQASQPHLSKTEQGFAQAQLKFYKSTLTPGVNRDSTGLRHERVSPPPRERRPHGRRLGDAAPPRRR